MLRRRHRPATVKQVMGHVQLPLCSNIWQHYIQASSAQQQQQKKPTQLHAL
jgi:hypothetical protein